MYLYVKKTFGDSLLWYYFFVNMHEQILIVILSWVIDECSIIIFTDQIWRVFPKLAAEVVANS